MIWYPIVITDDKLEIPAADGMAEAYVYTPSHGFGPWPGVLFLTDFAGIRDVNQKMAKILSEQGYVVVMPNIYYRTDRLPIIEEFDEFSKRLNKYEPKAVRRALQLTASVGPEEMRDDGKAFTDYLVSHTDVLKGRLGVVGYCFTGQMALRIAAHVPDLIGCAASFHGTYLVTDKPDSPHTELPKVNQLHCIL